MKVKDLIQGLSECDPEAEVWHQSRGGVEDEVEIITPDYKLAVGGTAVVLW